MVDSAIDLGRAALRHAINPPVREAGLHETGVWTAQMRRQGCVLQLDDRGLQLGNCALKPFYALLVVHGSIPKHHHQIHEAGNREDDSQRRLFLQPGPDNAGRAGQCHDEINALREIHRSILLQRLGQQPASYDGKQQADDDRCPVVSSEGGEHLSAPHWRKGFGLARLFAQHGPVHIRAEFFALDAGDGLYVRAQFGRHAIGLPLIGGLPSSVQFGGERGWAIYGVKGALQCFIHTRSMF